ncbi:hypothetical protein [Aquibacillus sediminis]|uniref:hypothetical protein n=1 Tax=Aquibacillus sediminis TaxID=2574734 RepID=UPI00148705EC|nr:hypothetical protein [Aquibacillus sediminis]
MLPSDPHEFEYGRHNEILQQGWELNLQTGKSIFDPAQCKVKTYNVQRAEGNIVVNVNKRRMR